MVVKKPIKKKKTVSKKVAPPPLAAFLLKIIESDRIHWVKRS